MFSPKSVSWKESGTLARYVKKSTLSKDLKKKIDLDIRKDKILIFKDSPDPETISTTDYNDINLGSKKFHKGWNSLLFWTTDKLSIKLDIDYAPSVGEPILRGIVKLQIMISTGRFEWEVGKKLIDQFFSDNYNKEFLNEKSIKKLLQEILKNNKKEFLKGLKSENKKNENFILELEQKTKNGISSLIKEQGLEIASLSLDWKYTPLDILKQREAKASAQLKGAIQDKQDESQSEAVNTQAFKNRINAEVAKNIKTTLKEKNKRHKTQEESETKQQEIRHKRVIDRERNKNKVQEKETELELQEIDSEIQIGKVQTEQEKNSIEFKKKINSLNEMGFDLKDPNILKYAIKSWGEEGSLLPSELKSSLDELLDENLDATNLDEQISLYHSKAIDREKYTKPERAYYSAFKAVLHRLRGNKDNQMEIALKESIRLDNENEVAKVCEIDYLWDRHPQQFSSGKLKIPHMREQVIRIEKLLSDLINSKRISKEEITGYIERHKYVLEVLIKEEELSQKYQERYQELYG